MIILLKNYYFEFSGHLNTSVLCSVAQMNLFKNTLRSLFMDRDKLSPATESRRQFTFTTNSRIYETNVYIKPNTHEKISLEYTTFYCKELRLTCKTVISLKLEI